MFEWLSVKTEISEVRIELWPTRWEDRWYESKKTKNDCKTQQCWKRETEDWSYIYLSQVHDGHTWVRRARRHDKTHVIRLKNVMRRQRRKGTDAQTMDKRDRSLIVRIHVAWTRRGSPPREPWDRNLVTRDALGSDEVAIMSVIRLKPWRQRVRFIQLEWRHTLHTTRSSQCSRFSAYTHREYTRYWCGAEFEVSKTDTGWEPSDWLSEQGGAEIEYWLGTSW